MGYRTITIKPFYQMSVITEFNNLDGKTVTRDYLHKLQDKAYNEEQSGNKDAFKVWSRIQTLLDKFPHALSFRLELDQPIRVSKSKLGMIEKKVKGNELIYLQGKEKLATIRDNGTITYHKKRLPAGLRNEIRKAANIIGLASPVEEMEIDKSMLHGLELIEEEIFTGLGKSVSQNDIYNYITDLIINTINQVGHLPWQKEWTGSGHDGAARNYVTKKPYTGANCLLNFDIKFDKQGRPYLVPIQFKEPYYLTFQQIKDAKATLKKDSKARRVIYYTMVYNFDNGTLKFKGSDKKKFTAFVTENSLTKEDLNKYLKTIPVIQYYNVYRADDCTGLKFPPKPKPKNTTPIQEAQLIIDGYPNPPKFTFIGADAYYNPASDTVNMPTIAAFSKEEFYYSTFFHELVHSTGSEKRLKRDFSGRFGNKEYAFEELIAELGATFLCGEAGILFTTRDNSAKYLKGWNKRLVEALENDNRFFLKASAQAQKAADWILNVKKESNGQEMAKKETATPLKKVSKTAKASKKQPIAKKTNGQEKTVLKPVKLTAAQKKRYDAELASDNWKKYSKTQKVTDNSKKVSDIAKKNENNSSKKPKPVQKSKTSATKKVAPKKEATKTVLSNYEKQELGIYVNYLEYKERNPSHVILMPFEDVYLTFNDDAKKVAEVVDIPLHTKRIDNKHYYKAVFPAGMLKLNIARLLKSNLMVGVVELANKKTGKKNALGAIHIHHLAEEPISLNSPIEVIPGEPAQIPVYINGNPDDETKEIVQAIKETIPAQSIVVHQPKPTNKLMQMTFDSLEMDEGFENLMQNPAKNMKIAIWGPPKNGKTAGSLKLANYLTKFGNVLYNFADQGFNKSTQDLWISSGLANNPKAEPSDISTLDALENEIKTGKYDFVFIDMISDYIRTEKITPQDFKERFMKQFPNVSFILIFEVTKGGNFKGDQGWTHLVDAIITVEDFFMENRGRYGTGDYVVWEEGFKKFNVKRYAEWLENNAESVTEEQTEEILTKEVESI